MVCARGVPGVTGTLGKANSHFDPTQLGSHDEAAVDRCSDIFFDSIYEFRHSIYEIRLLSELYRTVGYCY